MPRPPSQRPRQLQPPMNRCSLRMHSVYPIALVQPLGQAAPTGIKTGVGSKWAIASRGPQLWGRRTWAALRCGQISMAAYHGDAGWTSPRRNPPGRPSTNRPLAEREGFEPSDEFNLVNSLAVSPIRPLSHLSLSSELVVYSSLLSSTILFGPRLGRGYAHPRHGAVGHGAIGTAEPAAAALP
jgi:hypothetical protein